MRRLILLLVCVATPALFASPAYAATCSDYPNQAAAQAAHDTRDADGDGIYCESLPCPCSGTSGSTTPAPTPAPAPSPEPTPAPTPTTPTETAPTTPTTPVLPPGPGPTVAAAVIGTGRQPKPATRSKGCTLRSKVQPVGFSATKYPNIRQHYEIAVALGWPKILTLNRTGATARRARLLRDVPTADGVDRDEYPPALGRGRGIAKLRVGLGPIGWLADVQYVPSSENRSHGSTMGIKLRRFCNGQKFRYSFY